MPTNIQLLPQINTQSVRENGKQFYLDSLGRRFPSVTTILNATKPQAERDRLSNWKARIGTEEATRISTTASRRGTKTHKQIEHYLLNKNPVCPQASLPYWESIKPVLEEIDTIRLIEGSVFHYGMKYAGKVDCVASYKGMPCVCEWKTADKPKGSIESLYEYPLQTIAYLGAVQEYYQDYNLQLDHALLVIALPNLPAQVFWFEKEQIHEYWQKWEKRIVEYWEKRPSKFG